MFAPFQESLVIVNLISSVEFSKIGPDMARTCPPLDIVEAQKDFLARENAGKFVSLPRPITS